MASWIGISKNGTNYVPQPVPSYTPMGYHRCEICNRLMIDGKECDCAERTAPEPPREIKLKKYDYHEFKDHTKKGKRNGSMEHRYVVADGVLDGGRVGPDAGGRNSLPERSGQQEALKPCPFCGKSHLTLAKAYGKYKVKCTDCSTVYGPAREAPELARMAWNRRRA